MAGIEDNDIIELFIARDESAVAEVRKKYGGLCYSIAYNVLHNKEDAEECVNDLYISLWNAVPPAAPNNLKAYICKVVRNISLLRLKYNEAGKRNSKLSVSLSEIESALEGSEDTASDLTAAEEGMAGKLISEFLRQQKSEQREVFIRRYWFMDSIKQIAMDYSFSESKVKSMLVRTRSKLKRYLKKGGIDI